MSVYRLTAVRFRHVAEVNEKGQPVKVVIYRRGDLIDDLSDDDADRLLRAHAIVPIDGDDADTSDDDLSHDADGDEESTDDGAHSPTGDGAMPAKTAPVKAWRDYAISQGLNADEVADMDRKDLIEALA